MLFKCFEVPQLNSPSFTCTMVIPKIIPFICAAATFVSSALGTLLIKGPTSLMLNETSDATLQCIDNDSSSTLSWRGPNGAAIMNSTRIRIFNNVDVTRTSSTLEITTLYRNDSGAYTCSNGIASVAASISVLVYPRITYAPAVQNFTEGQQACIVCTVDIGYSVKYTLNWIGPDNARHEVLNTTMCVCILNITARDAGLYQYLLNVNGGSSSIQLIQVNVNPLPNSKSNAAPTAPTPPNPPTPHNPSFVPALELLNTSISILIIHGSTWDQSKVPQLTQHIEQYMVQNLSYDVTITSINLQYLIELVNPHRNTTRTSS